MKHYFNRLQRAISEYGIEANGMWNMDETGFQIGVGRGKQVVTQKRRVGCTLSVPINREFATCVESVSAAGECIPGFVILTGKVHQAKWYKEPKVPDDMVIGVSESGYTNDHLCLDWLKHFDHYTKNKTTGAYRLLIIDGYGSHHIEEFIDYCIENKIVPFGLPPHLSHIL